MPTPDYTPTIWQDGGAPPVSASNLQKIENQLDAVTDGVRTLEVSANTVTYGGSPPSTPINGDVWILPIGGGVLWRFRYNSASPDAYKWEFEGGAPQVVEYDTSGASFATNTVGFQEPDANCRITLPRDGDYDVVASGRVTGTGSQNLLVEAATRVGGTDKQFASDRVTTSTTLGSFGRTVTFHGASRHTAVTALSVATVVFKQDTGAAVVALRRVRVTPVRVA